MRFILLLLLLSSFFSHGQTNYPQDYFSNPLEIPTILAGSFAELRSNHFHSGLDIKTKQRVGLRVKAAADGFVSRIKVSHYGYGKALYITHPNGYTTVYAHLQKFAPHIETYVKKHQYEKESYEIELFPNAGDLKVLKDSLVAYSGNTGGSGGPHLHFEIRDKAEKPINPMLFGMYVTDTTKPFVNSIYAYPIGNDSYINQSNTRQKLRLIPLKNGEYTVENIEAYGTIGFGIETNDRQDLAANKNGVYNIETYINGNKNFELDFKQFSFSETKHINRLIDYEVYKKDKNRVQKLFNDKNPLSLIKQSINNGYLSVEDSTSCIYKVKISDFHDNVSWVTIPIDGKKNTVSTPVPTKTTPYYINASQSVNLKKDLVTVDFYQDTFYDDFYIDFEVNSDTLKLHEDTIPLKKSFTISYDVSAYSDYDKSKLYIARLVGYKNYPLYSNTRRKGDKLTTNTKTLGTYALATDTIKPTIEPKNFKAGQWLSKFRYLSVKIDDQGSGISNYSASVNGKWVLMEYDYKTKTLIHDFNDGVITDTKNNLKLIVTDNVGNNSTFETIFYRK